MADFDDTQQTSDDQSEQENTSTDTVDSSSSGDSGGVATDAATGDSSTGPSSPVNIHYTVSLVAQPDDYTCWAASSAMIRSYWHDVETSSSNPSYSVQDIKDQVANAGPQYDVSQGLKPEDTKPVGDILGLSFDYPMCYGVDGFASLLKDKGPVVFIRASMGGKGAHAIAVVGMNGDGTPDGTTVETLNPSPVGTGAAQNVSFTNLMTMMEQLGFWDQTDWSKDGGADRVYVMYKQ
ncbi:MAG TPA: papain-like cysteine protease family protein [Candidatus Udaeobacter sp.]|nr:papain-like cysteine protease family protein [Candidatus Udaeobacter sp.]